MRVLILGVIWVALLWGDLPPAFCQAEQVSPVVSDTPGLPHLLHSKGLQVFFKQLTGEERNWLKTHPAIASELKRGYNWRKTGGLMLLAMACCMAALFLIAFSYFRLKKEEWLHRHFEKTLLQNIEQNRIVLDSVGDGILCMDTEGGLKFVNHSALKMLGFSEQELQERGPDLLLHPVTDSGESMPGDDCPVCCGLSPGKTGFLKGFFTKKDGVLLPVEYITRTMVKDTETIGTVISFIDITERIKDEKKIRTSQENFRFAMMAANASYWHYDWLKDRITIDVGGIYENDSPLAIHKQGTLEDFLAQVHPDDQADVGNTILEYFRNESTFLKVDYRVFSKINKEWAWRHTMGRTVERDEQGRPVTIAGLTQDISERMGLLEAINTSRERLRIISRHTYDWQSWKDLEGNLVWVNQAVERVTGVSPEECMAMDNYPWPLVYEPDIAAVKELHHQALAGAGRQEKIVRVRHRDGRLIWVSWSLEPVLDHKGQVIGVAGAAKDITGQKEAERELRLMSRVFEDGADPILIVEHKTGNIINLNDAAANNYGYTRDELIGLPLLVLVPEELHDRGLQMYKKCITGDSFRDIEWLRKKRDGSITPVLMTFSLLKDDEGNIQGVAVSTKDISHLKQVEKELTDYRDQLEQLVEERTQDLALATVAAKKATQAKSDFLANISHEIRTPLNAITGFSYLALQTGLDPLQSGYIRKIQTSSNALLGIINDILDFSKIEAGKLTLESIEFNLNEVLETVANLVGIKAQEKGLEFIFSIDACIPATLIGDPLRLSQVLINLAGNAVKFTEKGNILVGCLLTNSCKDDVELVFFVQDSGMGLSMEQQGRLFQAFSQADTTTTRKFGGTGLGLSICKNLVEMMSGHIQVESKQGEGATFSFCISLKQPSSVTGAGPLIPDTALQGKKILVVDDNPVCLDALENMLEPMTFQVGLAPNFEKACSLLDTTCFDLMLLDGQMPGAQKLFDRISRMPRYHKDFPVVIMSCGPENGQGEFRGQNSQNLAKPIFPSLLLESVIKAFGARVPETLELHHSYDHLPHAESLRGSRLLVVENNEINQQVIKGILENNGIYVVITDNGYQALELLEKKTFDAVLMDINMPEMDGYTATWLIRQQYGADQLPVIAFSATADNEETAKAAGINDRVDKPVDVRNLFKVLCKWIAPVDDAAVTRPDLMEKACSLPGAALFSLPGINVKEGVDRLGGDISLYRNMLFKFANTQQNAHTRTALDLAQGDLDGARQTAHTIKGLAGNIGADLLYTKSMALERALKNKISEEAEQLMPDFGLALDAVIQAVNTLDQAPDPPGPLSDRSLPPDTIRSRLLELKDLLDQDDASAGKVARQLDGAVSDQGTGALFTRLAEQTAAFEYEAARKTLHTIIQESNK